MQDYLPPGYPHNVHAQEAVLAAIRLLLKHEGGLIRNVVSLFNPFFHKTGS
jgi:hypothetical protein